MSEKFENAESSEGEVQEMQRRIEEAFLDAFKDFESSKKVLSSKEGIRLITEELAGVYHDDDPIKMYHQLLMATDREIEKVDQAEVVNTERLKILLELKDEYRKAFDAAVEKRDEESN